jgi:phage terminase small subunit
VRRARGGLTVKQRRFVAEYLVDSNATQAAIRAGYSKATANEQGARLLAKASVQQAVAAGQQRIETKLAVSADQIAQELAKLGFSNMLDYIRIGPHGHPNIDLSALSRDQASALTSVRIDEYMDGVGEHARPVKKVEFRLADKRAALVDLAKLLGFWKERHEVEVGWADLLAEIDARRQAVPAKRPTPAKRSRR